MSLQIQPIEQAWATDITRIPPDRTKVYGGAFYITKSGPTPVYMRRMARHMTPILQTRPDPQTELLKQILSRLPGRQRQNAG